MKHLFSINAEGGPLLILDAAAAVDWNGAYAGAGDYRDLCAAFDATPHLAATVISVAGKSAIAWEMAGAGTADVFLIPEDRIRIIRAWIDPENPGVLDELAAAQPSSAVEIGELHVPTGFLAVLWAVESGKTIHVPSKSDIERVSGTSVEDSAFVMRVSCRFFRCRHDEIRIGEFHARRLTLVPIECQ